MATTSAWNVGAFELRSMLSRVLTSNSATPVPSDQSVYYTQLISLNNFRFATLLPFRYDYPEGISEVKGIHSIGFYVYNAILPVYS